MKTLPQNVTAYNRTPEFNQTTIPTGLLKAHQTKAGTWGLIVILEGRLLYRILEPAPEEVHLSTMRSGIVEPTVLHEVQALGDVRFYVEFYR